MTREKKSMAESRTIKTLQVFPEDTNHHNTLFGGRLMAHIDDVAAVAATRHSGYAVVTASTDSVDFIRPIRPGEVVSFVSFVTYTGNSSIEVCVKVISENILKETKELAAISFLTFVALDKDNKPVQVPEVYPESEDEIWLNRTGEQRAANRKKHVKQTKELMNFFSTKLYI